MNQNKQPKRVKWRNFRCQLK